jgi:hypothetical protein
VDEVKTTKSSLFIHPKQKPLARHCPAQPGNVWHLLKISPVQKTLIETSDRTMSGLIGHFRTYLRKPHFYRELPPDNVRDLNLSPTASFLRELYKYPSTSNGSNGVVTPFFY